MIQSIQANEWISEAKEVSREEGRVEGKAEGLLEGRIASLLELLTDRFGAIPEETKSKILAQKEVAILKDWFHKVNKVQSIEEFLSSLNS